MHGKFEDYYAHSIFANIRNVKPIIIRFLFGKMHICWYISSRAFPVHSEIYLQNVTFATYHKTLNCYKNQVFWRCKGIFKKKCYVRMLSSEQFYCRWAFYRWFLVNLVCTMNQKPWWQHRVIEPLAIFSSNDQNKWVELFHETQIETNFMVSWNPTRRR